MTNSIDAKKNPKKKTKNKQNSTWMSLDEGE